MDNAKVKNYIILVLALVNIFLLAIVLTNARQARKAASDRKQALEAVLSDNGIKLSEEADLSDAVLPTLTLKRDTEKEKELVTSLLGECAFSDLGGNVYSYKGKDGGEAKFRGTGEFDILLPSGDVKRGDDPAETAKRVLKKLGLKCSGETPELDGGIGDTTVVLTCAWDGTSVYNARVTFYFTATSLNRISGTRPFDKQTAAAAPSNCPDGITVLMNFLQSVRSTGDVCSEIRGLDMGYFVSSAVSGDCTLHPVWCIRTDSRAYYIDAGTGKSLAFEASA